MDAHEEAARTGLGHAEVAERFDAIVRGLLEVRRQTHHRDVTTRLMTLTTPDGRHLDDEELMSVLRNWTGGDLASMAACIGVVAAWMIGHPEPARRAAGLDDRALGCHIDEMLRLDDPFVSNRRVATQDTSVGGCPVHAGDVVVLDWRAANRDPEVFSDRFNPRAHSAANLVYGTGVHVCPGRGLATLQLRVVLRALVRRGGIEAVASGTREREPLAGWRSLPVRIVRPGS